MIQKLKYDLVAKIAAGEVVERPASVIKELLENSADAGATEIKIELAEGGIELLSIEDNGAGIATDELALAIQNHTTSKISQFEQLSQLESYGFRGEALSSISAVSQFMLSSRTADSDSGGQVQVVGNVVTDVTPIAKNVGTKVSVAKLFADLPARRSFLKSAATEKGQCKTCVAEFSLCQPGIQVQLWCDGKKEFDFPPEDLAARARRVIGENRFAGMTYLHETSMSLSIEGWVGMPDQRGSKDSQFLFINGRPVQDKRVSAAIRQAYSGLIHGHTLPSYALWLTCTSAEVDVNVHPAKREVRFKYSGGIYPMIVTTIATALKTAVPQRQAKVQRSSAAAPAQTATVASSLLGADNLGADNLGADNKDNKASLSRPTGTLPTAAPNGYPRVTASRPQRADAVHLKAPSYTAAPEFLSLAEGWKSLQLSAPDAKVDLGTPLTLFNHIFILAENEIGLVVVDVHAAHERMLFEQMRAQYAEGTVQAKQMLIPIELKMDEQMLNWADSQAMALQGLGIEITVDRDAGKVQIHSLPAVLPIDSATVSMVADLIQSIASDLGTAPLTDQLDHVIGNMACKQAMKSGVSMTMAEMSAFLRRIETSERSHWCNHGRPAWSIIPHNQLDRICRRGE